MRPRSSVGQPSSIGAPFSRSNCARCATCAGAAATPPFPPGEREWFLVKTKDRDGTAFQHCPTCS
eukprot:8576701-Prorocentrum_lima.AAC.1